MNEEQPKQKFSKASISDNQETVMLDLQNGKSSPTKHEQDNDVSSSVNDEEDMDSALSSRNSQKGTDIIQSNLAQNKGPRPSRAIMMGSLNPESLRFQ